MQDYKGKHILGFIICSVEASLGLLPTTAQSETFFQPNQVKQEAQRIVYENHPEAVKQITL
jgi:hypothetical protein